MSGSSGFFQFVAVTAIAMAGAVYAINHREDLHKIAELAVQRTMTPTATESEAEEPRSVSAGDDLQIDANDAGHFETEAEVNGSRIDVMVDTGATLVALSYEDAERAGIFLKPQDFSHVVSTANGRAKVAPVTLSRVSIGDITVRDVRAVVSEPGRLNTSLLGMSFLGRLSRLEMRSGTLYLQD